MSEQEKTFTIYYHKNKINGKMYIGQTCEQVEQRWKNGYGYRKCQLFYKAIEKYGWDNFEHGILKEHLTLDEANYWEKYYIQYYHTWIQDPLCHGYNLRSGGDNSLLSTETKRKISEAKKGDKNYNYGCHLSEETKEKLSQIMTEKWQDETFKEKMVAPRRGKHLSEETKKKISESNKGKIRSAETKELIRQSRTGKGGKKVCCINTGEIFNTLAEAANYYHTDSSSISKVCLGKRKTAGINPATGERLQWEYVQDET